MRLKYSASALRDLEEAGAFISSDDPEAAARMAARVREALEYLVDHPALGRPGRVSETRELVVSGTPFIVVYTVRSGLLYVVRVLHHGRKWM